MTLLFYIPALVNKMDINELILQGSALAVILGSFLLILQFLLNSFAKSMGEIEKAQQATTTALVELTHAARLGQNTLEHIRDHIEKKK